jgi:hypothetical protein
MGTVQLFKIPEWFIWLSFGGVFAATLWKGSWQTRLIAGSLFGEMLLLRAWILVTGHSIAGQNHERQWIFLVLDLGLLAIRLACALTTRRYWVLWTASTCLASMATGLLMPSMPGVTPWAYKWASYIWTYTALSLCLGEVWANARDEGAARTGREARTAAA